MENPGELEIVRMVRGIVLMLVDDRASANVTGVVGDGNVVVDVKVAHDDVGKLIGKQGRTARSLRTIVAAAAMANKVKCELNLSERTA